MVTRIEKIEHGKKVQTAERGTDGCYHCYPEGQTMSKYMTRFSNLDEAAKFLIDNQRGRIRMNPDWSLIVDNIHIDGRPRESF
ncbi:hypothetical protein PHIN109289_19220 [Phaeobacter inhibens]|uniref:hypothetical protein n=1 Tax=Phaeobacter inhibens TaxID=221822 RepID=UPI0004102660|nr:hypothetical protein [Phaeobacter inhibens]